MKWFRSFHDEIQYCQFPCRDHARDLILPSLFPDHPERQPGIFQKVPDQGGNQAGGRQGPDAQKDPFRCGTAAFQGSPCGCFIKNRSRHIAAA